MPIPTWPAEYPASLGYTFGITATQTGISLESFEQSDTTDVYEQKDAFGQVIEVVLHNPRSDITMHGQTNAALGSMLGQKITVTGMVSSQIAVGGSVICRTVAFTQGRAANQSARIVAVYYPLIPAGP